MTEQEKLFGALVLGGIGLLVAAGRSETVAKIKERFKKPVPGAPVTSNFGFRWGKQHKGIDFGVPIGTPVLAAASGTVKRTGYQADGAGNYVVLGHGTNLETKYFHLDSISVQVGRSIAEGEMLGHSGNTGKSTGPHLHFEVWSGTTPVDPATVLV